MPSTTPVGGISARPRLWTLLLPWALVLVGEVILVPTFGLFTLVFLLGQLVCWIWAVVATAFHISGPSEDLFDSGDYVAWWTRDLSITAKAISAGKGGAVYIPQNSSITGSIGYLHTPQKSVDLEADGQGFDLDRCLHLTDDWYWC